MISTIEKFLQSLVDIGILCEVELDELFLEEPPDQPLETPELLGQFLVDKRKLTKYQIQKILQEQTDELLLGQYIIQDVIRNGAMGVVYRARHPRMKRDVAVKVILTKLAEDPECVARFHREVHLAARLNHPNIVTAFDAAEENGRLFLVMECIEGEDLKTIINKQGTISIEDAVDYISQAARGLKYAHERGVIHRDVKPSNLLLDASGTVKILDVGLAMEESRRNDSDLTLAGGLLGSVNYMAPEQAQDARNADARSDIYSLGCTLWYLLSGSVVYEEKTVVNRILAHRERPVPDLESLGDEIPSELQRIFQNMIAKHPDDRYQSMADLLMDLESLQLDLKTLDDGSLHVARGSTCARSSHDTEPLRHSSETQLIELPNDPSEECASDDPTTVTYEAIQPRKLSAATIVIAGFSIGCLVMVGIKYLEQAEMLNFQNSKSAAVSPELERGSLTIEQSAKPTVSTDNHDEETEVSHIRSASATSTADSPQQPGIAAGPPHAAETPFSPEQARLLQQQWAEFLGLEAEQSNSLGVKMILIPPGIYQMGSDENDLAELVRMFPDELLTISKHYRNETPRHTVTLTRPYLISAHEVTFAQFQQFVNDSGYEVQEAAALGWQTDISKKTSVELQHFPVRHICWNDAAAFCRWLSEKEQREYRLPTEAEWEYACRAGSQELFGHNFESLNDQEWWKENANWPRAVGLKTANAFGLFDMRGNLREYCQDRYSPFSPHAQTDPLVLGDESLDHRVVRGGGASSKRYEIRPGRRNRVPASDKVVSYISFRIVTPLELPTQNDSHTGNMLTSTTNGK